MRRLPATRPGGRDRLLPPFTAQIALFPEQRKILAGELAEMGAENRVLAELAAQLEAAGDDPSRSTWTWTWPTSTWPTAPGSASRSRQRS